MDLNDYWELPGIFVWSPTRVFYSGSRRAYELKNGTIDI